MIDIVDRLLQLDNDGYTRFRGLTISEEAATEITTLRSENERLREALRIISASVFNDNGDVTYDTSGLLKAARIAKEALK